MAFPNSKGSFAQRAAAIASNIESWDDDGDFQGDLFMTSVSTAHTSMSARVSVRSESNVGDDDWQVLLTSNDDLSRFNAISSAKQAGIPIPSNVPSSALLGGSIKRLGKKKSQRKIVADDDWGDDIELPATASDGLRLKTPQLPRTPAEDQDDFDDWGEGSLGIRWAGTRRDQRNRSSSVSAMSPSMGSCMTLESEDDDLNGLVLPNEPLDFNARLNKLKEAELKTPDISPLPAHQRREPPPTSAPTSLPPSLPSTPPTAEEPKPDSKPKTLKDDNDDFFADLDIGSGDIINNKVNLNRNVQVRKQRSQPLPPPAARPATTITFTDKPSTSRIPRLLPSSTSRSKLPPVYESGALSSSSHNRPVPTTTNAQLLRSKRSAPILRNNYSSGPKPPVPFLPAGIATSQSHHVAAKPSQGHPRRDSDPNRPQSPAMRSYSRMSATNPPDTPSRAAIRKDMAPAALAREAAAKHILAKPIRRRQFGDGSELEVFDDLPTSATKEKKFEKVPITRGPSKVLRHQQSNSRLPLPDRMTTPLPPPTPRSPTKADSTPRFARDTAASRIAREQRLASTRSRAEGPIVPVQTNWKAQVAARSPHSSPTAQRGRKGTGQKPMLIKAMSAPMAKNEKGMTYNPVLHRWEGNEAALAPFSHPNVSTTTLALTTASTPTFAPPNQHPHHQHDRSHSISHTALSAFQAQHSHPQTQSRQIAPGPPSPPRPALISNISAARGVQVERGMVFDPRKMCWLKLGPSARSGDPRSPSADMDDEEDPFAGLEDLKDDESKVGVGAGGAASVASAGFGEEGKATDPTFVGEEFDLGPSFIRRQREEETVWRRKVESWVGGIRDGGDGWRWAVRDLAALAAAENLRR
ncbi:hypothetical protein K432DRAFT_328401 [Lepidopterella palustris CBS 459.81]|uniref:Cytokinesis regulator n=1 Tax=Lepidopterella palustris CBS 459.81 TaxID=1314670 RepID=A0A8E2EB41_9PEZI|nr:hypothetical protein K432DRAFT_328401 [Lepidopterella palustris CBS 459.81]